MEYYIVYWPQDVVRQFRNAGDTGPIQVLYGSLHSRMPTIASIQPGDIVYPVTLIKKELHVMARLPVEHRETAFDYLMRELGHPHGALFPDGIVVEYRDETGTPYFWSSHLDCYHNRADVPPDLQLVPAVEPDKPHQAHQEPFNCCSQHAVWGTQGTSIAPRRLPPECIPDLRFGPKGKERPLTLRKDGSILTSSLTVTRRMTPETAVFFEALFA